MRGLFGFSVFFTIVILMFVVASTLNTFAIYALMVFFGAFMRYTGVEKLGSLTDPEPGPFILVFNEALHFIAHIIGLSVLVYFSIAVIVMPWLKNTVIAIP